jgi:hypothetical protein
MTERAALADARRNLLEALKGVRVNSASYVESFILKNDEIRLQAEGLIQASAEVRNFRRYLSDGAIEVTVAMNLGGDFLHLLMNLPQLSPVVEPSAPSPLTPEKPRSALSVPPFFSPPEVASGRKTFLEATPPEA